MSVESILGQHEASLNKQAGTDRVGADKDTFLKLLVAQLSNQDPLNPVEDKEFIAQLAQFTSVEELQNINAGIKGMGESFQKQDLANAVNLLGALIELKGDTVTVGHLEDGSLYSTPYSVDLPRDAVGGTFNVYNSAGTLVFSDTLENQLASSKEGTIGSLKAGKQSQLYWDGLDGNGNKVPADVYTINISAVDDKGEKMLANMSSTGEVMMVETGKDGKHKLLLKDGRSTLYSDVTTITSAGLLGGGSDGKEDEDTEGETDTTKKEAA